MIKSRYRLIKAIIVTDIEGSSFSPHLFPSDWQMSRRLTREFCTSTKVMLASVASLRGTELLLHAVK
jgi:hypothetical protein